MSTSISSYQQENSVLSNNSGISFDFEGYDVRVIQDEQGEPWFVLSDVCKVLGIGNPSDAASRLDEEEVTLGTIEGSHRPTNTINESGLYSLILTSRKPQAKRFKKWVTGEVLPQIRKTGSYQTQPALDLTNLDQVSQLLIEQADRIKFATTNWMEEHHKRVKLENEIEQVYLPKSEAFDNFMESDGTYTIGNAAKLLDAGIGRNKLFHVLRSNGILMSDPNRRNEPYQRFVDAEFFKTKVSQVQRGGKVIHTLMVYVTPKGLDWMRKNIHGWKAVAGV
jgi:prophage antirepressor-like protein